MTAGIQVFGRVLQMAAINKISFANTNRQATFHNGITLTYDPADSRCDINCSEFLYLHKDKKQILEGFIWPNGEGAYCRTHVESNDETALASADALAGFIFARLHEAHEMLMESSDVIQARQEASIKWLEEYEKNVVDDQPTARRDRALMFLLLPRRTTKWLAEFDPQTLKEAQLSLNGKSWEDYHEAHEAKPRSVAGVRPS
jgi:hypothetical protein